MSRYIRVMPETSLSRILDSKAVLLEQEAILRTIPELAPCVGFEQNNPYHCYTVYEHIVRAVASYPGDDLIVKLAFLLHDIGKPACYTEDERGGHFYGHAERSAEIAMDVLPRLGLPLDTCDKVVELVRHHGDKIAPTEKSVRRAIRSMGEAQFSRLLAVQLADTMTHSELAYSNRLQEYIDLSCVYNTILEKDKALTVRDLDISGKDVINAGVPEGPAVGKLLNALLLEVTEGKLPNRKDVLLAYVKVRVQDKC